MNDLSLPFRGILTCLAPALVLAGCMDSAGQGAMPALAKKGPAYIRFVNFSKSPLSVTVKTREIVRGMSPGDLTPFEIIGAGSQPTTVSDGTSSFKLPMSLDAGSATTLIFTSDLSKPIRVLDEERIPPKGKSAIRLVNVNSSKPISLLEDGKSVISDVAVTKSSPVQEVTSASGSWAVGSAKLDSLEVDHSYTVFFDQNRQGAKALSVDNTPVNKPIAGHSSGAG